MGGPAGPRGRANSRPVAADVQAGSGPRCFGLRGCKAGLLRAGVWALAAGLGVVCDGSVVGGGSRGRCLVRMGRQQTTTTRSYAPELAALKAFHAGGEAELRALAAQAGTAPLEMLCGVLAAALGRPTHAPPHLGELSAASAALEAAPLAPATLDTVAELREPAKRPQSRQVPLPPWLAEFDAPDLLAAPLN